MAAPGLLIVDTNCYKDLHSTDTQRLFRRRAEMAGLIPAPSSVNLAEAVCAPAARRTVNFAAMKSLMHFDALLPWPLEILTASGRELLGESVDGFRETGFEWMLDDPDGAGATAGHTGAELRAMEARTAQRLDASRPRIQKRAKELNIRGQWEGARSFLDYWWDGEMAATVAEFYWRRQGLPGDPPIQAMFATPVWRLIIDVEAIAMYGRCVVVEQQRRVGYVDLIQLLYLSLASKRVLVTNDGPFAFAAETVLSGRYADSRVISLAQLVG